MQRYERRVLLIERRKVLGFAYGRFEIAVGLAVMHGDPPAFAVQDQLHTTEIALNLADPRDRAGRVQHAGCDLIDVLFLSYRKHLPVGSFKDRKSTRLNS